MAKEFVISTSRVNSYGCRVLTEGIDVEQFKKNPILLYMHRRGYDGESMPIGRVDNVRIDGDRLIGTPVFDMDDPFASKIAKKWEGGFLNMCSAGIQIIEVSNDPALMLAGQVRGTITKSRLDEVSIADIGSNDDSLKLFHAGAPLQLAAGEENNIIPLLKSGELASDKGESNDKPKTFSMKEILMALSLPETATEADALKVIAELKDRAGKVESIELARITGAVDEAIKASKTTADKRDHFIALGKAAGFESLQETLNLLTPVQKPNQLINSTGGNGGKPSVTFAKMSDEQLRELRENDRAQYIKLYREEFGFDPVME